jgi:neopullulanase
VTESAVARRGSGAPAWVADTVFYQVFPDRFARSGRVPAPGPLQEWDAPPDHWSMKGGDLFGLAERLDELAELGIGGIYLNPIFSATSNHRYNASDFETVDPLLGGEAAFRELLDRAHERGIRIVLDGVFNHCGRGFGPFQHVLENGLASPYRDWFYLDDDVLAGRRRIDAFPADGHHGPPGYRSWWDHQALPKLRLEHSPVREYVLGVAERWLRFGIDGWRLDVPADVEDPTFWPAFRERVRAINPEAYLVGEIWDEAPDWLSGDRFDALMNYPLGVAILGFASGGRLDQAAIDGQSDYRRALRPLDGPALAARLEHLGGSLDPAVGEAQYNLIGSHDTPRARRVLAGDVAGLQLATLLLLTLPGAPSIYYGDELAMDGGPDPDCRRGYPTTPDGPALEMRTFVRAAIAARRDHRALRRGGVRIVAAQGGAIAFERVAGDQRAIVAINAAREPARLIVPEGAATGLGPVPYPSIAAGRVVDGRALELPLQGALVLARQAA